MPENPDTLLLDWSLVPAAHHNVRALCDLEGLTYEQKQNLTACVMEESGFDINAVHENWGFDSNGVRVLESTDYGIVQINDYWHIGPDKDFPSKDYVLANPETDVRFMCRYYLQHGHLDAWCSWSSGRYKKYLGKV